MNATTAHTCYGAIFCGAPRDRARAECPACTERAAEARFCYHPRSCRSCDVAGAPCGRHTTADDGHDRCTGRGNADEAQETMEGFVQRHQALGHDATFTVAGAPGTGRGTWCHTCKTYGPNDIRVLSPGETK